MPASPTTRSTASTASSSPRSSSSAKPPREEEGFTRFCSSSLFEPGTFRAGEFGLVERHLLHRRGEHERPGVSLLMSRPACSTAPRCSAARRGRTSRCWTPATRKTIAIIVGDDRQGGPALAVPRPEECHGRRQLPRPQRSGRWAPLWVWVCDTEVTKNTPAKEFHGHRRIPAPGVVRPRSTQYDPAMAGQVGYDALGYAQPGHPRRPGKCRGGRLSTSSRPEDVCPPTLPTAPEFVLAATGRGSAYPSDNWGDHLPDRTSPSATRRADGEPSRPDDADNDPDATLRSPDNIDWADTATSTSRRTAPATSGTPCPTRTRRRSCGCRRT